MALKQKCIWLVGASSGLGKALALELIGQNNFVIASSRSAQALDELALAGEGKIKPLVFDVTCDEAALRDVGKRLGAITDYLDAVIYCAGICEYEDDLKFDPALYARVFAVNFHGAIQTLHLAKPLLVKSHKQPMVVLFGSLSSELGLPRAEAYGASKAALAYFAKALRADCVNLPLSVHLVRPGFVDTPLTRHNDFPMPWLQTPQQAAKIILRDLNRGRFAIDFPRRLLWLLRMARGLPWLWYRLGAARVTRHTKKSWRAKPVRSL